MRICVYCKNEFEPNSSKQVCCSKLCNVKKWRKENPEKAKINDRTAELKRKGKRVYSSEYRKNWYKKNKENSNWLQKIRKQENDRALKIKKFISEFKLKIGCKDCGYNKHHAALDFDHIKGNKSINVSHAKSINSALKEIEKCEVVCSNCHRIRTYNRLFEKTYELA
jgi:hypothetical protein